MNNIASPTVDKGKITEIVIDAIRDANQLRSADQKIEETDSAPLFGGEGKLDSLGLVSLLMDIEEMLLDEGLEVSLSSEDAMSRSRSPYRDVGALVDYIVSCSEENA